MEEQAERGCFVYLIGTVDGNRVKIGISNDPDKRLAAIQTASPAEVTVLSRIRYPDIHSARTVEAGLHQTFADLRLRGEWYDDESRRIVSSFQMARRLIGRAACKSAWRQDFFRAPDIR